MDTPSSEVSPHRAAFIPTREMGPQTNKNEEGKNGIHEIILTNINKKEKKRKALMKLCVDLMCLLD